MTPEQRRLRAQIAANARWSRHMARSDQADAARTAIFARLERQVDPDQLLNGEERAVLVKAAARRLSATLNAARLRKSGLLPSGISGLRIRAIHYQEGTDSEPISPTASSSVICTHPPGCTTHHASR
jgi:hypothetical protein